MATEQKTTQGQEQGVLIDALATLHEGTLLDQKRLAAILSVEPRTIRRMVTRFELPPPVSFAGRSVWLSDRILAHLDAAAERAEREAQRRERKILEMTA